MTNRGVLAFFNSFGHSADRLEIENDATHSLPSW
jgi:hypothetical protein